MRKAFAQELLEQAKKNPNILLLSADLGFSVFEGFEAELPQQYLNTGCSETNTLSMAAGLALSGKKVFVYSIVPFITMRCFEQIRIDVCYHNVDVIIVGVGGGLAYGQLGCTHHAIEDIAILRSLPNMKVVCPGDPVESRLATRALVGVGGPAYLRLNRGGDPVIFEKEYRFVLGKAYTVMNGEDLAIVSTGALLQTAMNVSKQLKERGIYARVLSMPTVKPIDEKAIKQCLEATQGIVTLEEHNVLGGLGSAVAEVIAEQSKKPYLFHRIGIRDRFTKEVGGQDYLRRVNGLDSEHIFATIHALWRKHSMRKQG